MKKRVVAVLLSLSMCMATAAEATAVSAADFSAEIAVTEDNEEPVADEEADSNEETDDPAVTIDEAVSDEGEEEDVDSEPEFTKESEDADMDFVSEADFTSEADVTADTQDILEEEKTEAVGTVYPGEEDSITEAKLSYLRWKYEEDSNGKLQWRLYKYTGAKAGTAEDAADAAETTGAEETTVTEGTVTEETSAAVETAEDIQNTEEAVTEEVAEEIPADSTETDAAEETTDPAAVAETKTPAYYTDKDGLVQITTLDASGAEVFTAKYAFDANGYLCTGDAKAGDSYYYFNTVSDVKVINPDLNPAFADIKAPYNSKLGQMQTNKWYWDTSAKAFKYYDNTGVRINIAKRRYIRLARNTIIFRITVYRL